MAGKLFLVGTPIGNLSDFSPRAINTLRTVDFIAAEDTRVTLKLLNHFDLKKNLVSYYEHNKKESGEKILSRILNGENCALVSDAGMPAISDPGEALVALCHDNNIEVVVIPGPSAVVSAVALSGLPSGRFTFEGFLSTSKKARFEHLKSLKEERRTMVFYEAPHKLLNTLNDMVSIFGNRRISISREITKLHEETLTFTLPEALQYFTDNPPRGEFVLVIEGAPENQDKDITLEEAAEIMKTFINSGMSRKDAAKQCSAQTGFSKNVLYNVNLDE